MVLQAKLMMHMDQQRSMSTILAWYFHTRALKKARTLLSRILLGNLQRIFLKWRQDPFSCILLHVYVSLSQISWTSLCKLYYLSYIILA